MVDDNQIKIWGAGTTRTFRPIWIAQELGVEFEHIAFGPRTGETQSEDYTKLNPKQKIPYLVDGGVKLSESVAISRYLIERYGQPATMTAPSCYESRAKEDEWVCYIYGELDETSLYVMRRHGDLKAIFGDAPDTVQAAKAYANKHFQVVADHLKDREYVLGDQLGLADVLLVSCIDWAKHYNFELPDTVESYHQNLVQREAYQKAFVANYEGHI